MNSSITFYKVRGTIHTGIGRRLISNWFIQNICWTPTMCWALWEAALVCTLVSHVHRVCTMGRRWQSKDGFSDGPGPDISVLNHACCGPELGDLHYSLPWLCQSGHAWNSCTQNWGYHSCLRSLFSPLAHYLFARLPTDLGIYWWRKQEFSDFRGVTWNATGAKCYRGRRHQTGNSWIISWLLQIIL